MSWPGTSSRTNMVPLGSLAADIEITIEQHLDVGVECSCGQGTAQSIVDGVDTAALAIVELLRSKGVEVE
jgi:hypothetical protein